MTEKITAKEHRDMQKRPTRSKYNAKKVEIDGHNFPSKKEAHRYLELKTLENAGEISHLSLQPKFRLLDPITHNGKKIRKVDYTADFYYIDNEGREIIEEVKGHRTQDYVIRMKLFIHKYGERYTFIET